ncbi:MAG: glutathione S-transferase N-terminal domain-containing protein, partial [Gemmatimonadota bacterium]
MEASIQPFKLYFSPGACSLSPHIALREAGLPFELVRVDFTRGRAIGDGRHLSDVNPKNYVPVLELPEGKLLTEGVAMV